MDTQQQQCVVPVSRDMRGWMKVFFIIELANDVHEGKNIDSIDQKSATKTPLEMLEGRKIDMKPIKLSVGLPPKRKVGCALDFGGKVVMQTGPLR
ncbi:hypothetical protein J1N35_011630 [Gossypium stocksii]|uniref:Uncharacterized protein n=1 Tax=Gossypium stocksii TaxID=47602 RepID=A0A9D4ABM7_9ROSI|nr:hypothetical protein J1N35_011630 [Gossypium stocksii]